MDQRRAEILEIIIDHFEQWTRATKLAFLCRPGCATCCTRNVTITAGEGERIHGFINEQRMNHWFAEKLQEIEAAEQLLTETTNEFAAHCLAGRSDSSVAPPEPWGVCPFLAAARCRIYPVRPFACRCFSSQIDCQSGHAAQLPEFYIGAATAAQQLIEHVGQGEYWGNMVDVLLALSDLKENEATAALLRSRSVADQARGRVRRARPLPGFLIGADEYERISPFLLAVFNARIENKTVEDILNGK